MIGWWKWWIHFFFYSLFLRENCTWSPSFLFTTAWFNLNISGKTTSWITLVCPMVWWDLFFMVYTSSLSLTSRIYVHFPMTHILQHCFTWSNNQYLLFLFLQTYLLINLISVCIDTLILCNLLVNLFPSFCLLLVLLRMLWILLTSKKPFHVPHALRITTWGAFFHENII